MKRFPQPQKFIPKNPQKYVGDVNNIILRSSWEKKFAIWADRHPNVVKWFNEEIHIPYLSPVDQRVHRYFPDFGLVVEKNGKQKRYIVEIKPYSQCVPPVGAKKTKRLLTELATYSINQAKWEAARAFCRNKGIEFLVLTENELGV